MESEGFARHGKYLTGPIISAEGEKTAMQNAQVETFTGAMAAIDSMRSAPSDPEHIAVAFTRIQNTSGSRAHPVTFQAERVGLGKKMYKKTVWFRLARGWVDGLQYSDWSNEDLVARMLDDGDRKRVAKGLVYITKKYQKNPFVEQPTEYAQVYTSAVSTANRSQLIPEGSTRMVPRHPLWKTRGADGAEIRKRFQQRGRNAPK